MWRLSTAIPYGFSSQVMNAFLSLLPSSLARAIA
jgi:hypothetical protein